MSDRTMAVNVHKSRQDFQSGSVNFFFIRNFRLTGYKFPVFHIKIPFPEAAIFLKNISISDNHNFFTPSALPL